MKVLSYNTVKIQLLSALALALLVAPGAQAVTLKVATIAPDGATLW